MTLTPTTETILRTGSGTGAEEAEGNSAASWPRIEGRLRSGAAVTWLSLRSERGVHTRPVFAAWTGTSFVHASNPGAVKTRHLEAGHPCSLALDLGPVHLAVEVRPARLTVQAELERAVAAFSDVYGWPTTVVGDEIDAPFAAPTSGGPPFRVYELTPIRAFAFPSSGDEFEPTRFVF
jgi:hypothetical protein